MGATMGKNGGTILDSLPSTQGTLHIVMLGLDSAGKTTALYRLKFDQYLNTVPTIGFNCEKVRGACGKAKGAQFLVWDVGGQEKLRPLWRSYTRCTDGIVFVLDSVDVERMEEAKMELMRTAKCPDNQGVPVLILANKQDLPGAREPKHIEKLLGLHELSPIGPLPAHPNISANCASSAQQQQQHNTSTTSSSSAASTNTASSASSASKSNNPHHHQQQQQHHSSHSLQATDPNATIGSNHSDSTASSNQSQSTTLSSSSSLSSAAASAAASSSQPQPMKGWYIQPACAITGEGLQEGLEALYDMIIKKRKLNKTHRKKR